MFRSPAHLKKMVFYKHYKIQKLFFLENLKLYIEVLAGCMCHARNNF